MQHTEICYLVSIQLWVVAVAQIVEAWTTWRVLYS